MAATWVGKCLLHLPNLGLITMLSLEYTRIRDTYTLNFSDDKPKYLFGPEVEGKFQEGGVPPFYVSLNIHDKILHNTMLDSGASNNLMPKVVMED